MNDLIALFDMDQTLFDFEGQMRFDLEKMRSPGEPNFFNPNDPAYIANLWVAEDEHPWLKVRMDLIKARPGWWRDLPRLNLGWIVFGMCLGIGFENQILTKGPTNKPHVWAEKVECVRQCPELRDAVIHITSGGKIDGRVEAKGQVYARVLVDDYPPYVLSWLKHKKRGLAIMPWNPENAGFTHPNVITAA